jgi:hypothetical protein
MADDELIDMDWSLPAAVAAPVPRVEPRHGRGARTSLAMARATIPSALVMLALLPALGVGWFLLPGDAPLKIGGPGLPVALMAAGLCFGVGAALLMRHVAVQLARRPAVDRR